MTEAQKPLASKLVFLGYCNVDENFYPDGRLERLPGGAAYFGALAASKFFQPVRLVTRLGNDFDESFFKGRVDPDGLIRMSDVGAGRSVHHYLSDTDPTARTVTLHSGADQFLEPTDLPDEWWDDLAFLHVATMPPTRQLKFIEAFSERNRAGGSTRSITSDTELSFLSNAQHLEALKHWIRMIDLVFLNRHEAAFAQELLPVIPHVVVKRDADGAELLEYGKVVASATAAKVQVVDATGAGDVLAGTFLASLATGLEKGAALQRAVDCATRKVSVSGLDALLD
jgi:sugar/nucleoside kinase (ribokinase family)